MKWKAITGSIPEAALQEDRKTAVKAANARLGREAFYFPLFPTGARYLPLSALTRAWVQESAISPSGCCGGRVPVYLLRLQYGENQYENLTFDQERDAVRTLSLLKERRPELPGAPERNEETPSS